MKQEIDNNAMWAAFRQELALQGELQVVAAIDNALNNLGFTIEETSTIVPIPLKQGEQKPADKVEPKFKVGDTVTVKPMSCHGKVFKGEPFKIVDIIEDNYVSDDGKAYSISLQDGWELVEQNPAWSEEDEAVLDALIRSLEGEHIYVSPHLAAACLKSLKERVQPKPEWKQENTEYLTDFENAMMHIGGSFFGQYAALDPNDTNEIKKQANILLKLVPKHDWGKENEKIYQSIMDDTVLEIPLDGKQIDWLKSLKGRHTWKPSEEQMDALRYVTNFDYGGHKATLVSLY